MKGKKIAKGTKVSDEKVKHFADIKMPLRPFPYFRNQRCKTICVKNPEKI